MSVTLYYQDSSMDGNLNNNKNLSKIIVVQNH